MGSARNGQCPIQILQMYIAVQATVIGLLLGIPAVSTGRSGRVIRSVQQMFA